MAPCPSSWQKEETYAPYASRKCKATNHTSKQNTSVCIQFSTVDFRSNVGMLHLKPTCNLITRQATGRDDRLESALLPISDSEPSGSHSKVIAPQKSTTALGDPFWSLSLGEVQIFHQPETCGGWGTVLPKNHHLV